MEILVNISEPIKLR